MNASSSWQLCFRVRRSPLRNRVRFIFELRASRGAFTAACCNSRRVGVDDGEAWRSEPCQGLSDAAGGGQGPGSESGRCCPLTSAPSPPAPRGPSSTPGLRVIESALPGAHVSTSLPPPSPGTCREPRGGPGRERGLWAGGGRGFGSEERRPAGWRARFKGQERQERARPSLGRSRGPQEPVSADRLPGLAGRAGERSGGALGWAQA